MKITNAGRAPALVDTVVDYARIEIDSDAMLVSRGCFHPDALCSDFGHRNPSETNRHMGRAWSESSKSIKFPLNS